MILGAVKTVVVVVYVRREFLQHWDRYVICMTLQMDGR